MTSDFRHPRHARVRTGAEYERVFKTGKRAALPAAALHWCRVDVAVAVAALPEPHGQPEPPATVGASPDSRAPVIEPGRGDVADRVPPVRGVASAARRRPFAVPSTARLGLAVSRKVDPHAVGRNRIKRVWRDAFRQVRTRLPVADYVLVARPPCRHLDNAALRMLLLTLLQRVGALPLQGGAVTLGPVAPDPALPAPLPTPSDPVPAPASVEPLRP